MNWPGTARFRRLMYTLLLLGPLCQSVSLAADQTITLWNRNFDTAPVNEILALALQKTNDLYPELTIRRSAAISFHEAINDLRNDSSQLDVLSAAASQQLEAELTPIYFPVLKGLLGQRLCLIRKMDQERFHGIQTAFDISKRKISICQGEDWPDTEVLKRNGLDVVTSTDYQQLFKYLKKKRCDCFLRGAQEIEPEYQKYADWLAIEKTLLIHYLEPGYFYVNKDNIELATRIELGLLRALDDGSYQELFNTITKPYLEKLQLGNRQKIYLNNPNLSEKSMKLDSVPSLWLQK